MDNEKEHEPEFTFAERATLQQFEAPEPPSEIRNQVLSQILEQGPQPSWWTRLFKRPRYTFVGALALAAVLAVFWMSHESSPETSSGIATTNSDAGTSSASAEEHAEQLEPRPICAGAYDLNKCIEQAHHRGLAIHGPRTSIPRYEAMMAMQLSPNEGE